jgi:general secretion pathway protein G
MVMKKTALFSKTGPSSFFRKGFTLIELVIVISIIAILSTMAFFGFSKAQASARDASRQQIMNQIRSSLERYYADNQYYPGVTAASTTKWKDLVVTDLAGYIPVPTDPCKGSTAIPDTGTMGAGNCAPAAYAYTPLDSTGATCTTAGKKCQSYTLTLTKEAGGTSTWTNPQ